jgi:hypothetical protein
MKLRSAPLDDVFNELDFSLREVRTPAATLLRREAHRRYRALHREFLRLLRAVNRGQLAQRRALR